MRRLSRTDAELPLNNSIETACKNRYLTRDAQEVLIVFQKQERIMLPQLIDFGSATSAKRSSVFLLFDSKKKTRKNTCASREGQDALIQWPTPRKLTDNQLKSQIATFQSRLRGEAQNVPV
jgi:hypothetical protein